MLVGRGTGGRGRGNGRGDRSSAPPPGTRPVTTHSPYSNIQDKVAPTSHQEDDGPWTTVSRNNKSGNTIGSERSTRYKYRIHVHMTLAKDNNTNFINVPYHQRLFCNELFRVDKTTTCFKWKEEESSNVTTKTNPITAAAQLPNDKQKLSEWIAGTTASTNTSNAQVLKFYMFIETSTQYRQFRELMKPWLDANKHRMWTSKLRTTNNRILAWVKDAHPDWTRLDELQKSLSELIIRNSEFLTCEIDLRPRKSRLGKGPQAMFIWSIGLTCSLPHVNPYLQALIQGFVDKEHLPENLRHIQIIPYHEVEGLITNDDIIGLARDHDNLMVQLRKKSIIGYGDIFTQQTIKSDGDDVADSHASYSLQEFLLLRKSQSGTFLFHSVESRGPNGYLVIFKEHLAQEVHTFFHNIRDNLHKTFTDEYVDKYITDVKSNFNEIDLRDDNSAISSFSVAETYYQTIKPRKHATFSPDVDDKNSQPLPNSGAYNPRKRTQITLTYGATDDISSLGSRSAQGTAPNAWNTPPNINVTPTPTSPATTITNLDDTTVSTLKTDVQSWFNELHDKSKSEWENNMQEVRSLSQKLTEMTTKYEEARQQIADLSTKQSQAMDEQKQYLKHAIQNDIQQFVAQSISQQFQLMHAQGQIPSSPSQSPARKHRKPTSALSPTMHSPVEYSQEPVSAPNSPPAAVSVTNNSSASRSPRPTTGSLL